MNTAALHLSSFFGLIASLAGGVPAFVRSSLIVPDDARATATNILAHEPLFRALVAAHLLAACLYAATTVILYVVLKPLNQRLSLVAGFVGIVSCSIMAFASLFDVAALIVLDGAQYLHIMAVPIFPGIALVLLKLRAQAYGIGLVVFAVYVLLIVYVMFERRVLNAKIFQSVSALYLDSIHHRPGRRESGQRV